MSNDPTNLNNNVIQTGPQPSVLKKRIRKKAEEIDRSRYICGWEGCEKSYRTLSHLNMHIVNVKHGPKHTPSQHPKIEDGPNIYTTMTSQQQYGLVNTGPLAQEGRSNYGVAFSGPHQDEPTAIPNTWPYEECRVENMFPLPDHFFNQIYSEFVDFDSTSGPVNTFTPGNTLSESELATESLVNYDFGPVHVADIAATPVQQQANAMGYYYNIAQGGQDTSGLLSGHLSSNGDPTMSEVVFQNLEQDVYSSFLPESEDNSAYHEAIQAAEKHAISQFYQEYGIDKYNGEQDLDGMLGRVLLSEEGPRDHVTPHCGPEQEASAFSPATTFRDNVTNTENLVEMQCTRPPRARATFERMKYEQTSTAHNGF
jgi:hypothetical protein